MAPSLGSFAAQQGGGYSLEFSGHANIPHSLETSTNLVDWTFAGSITTDESGFGHFLLSPAPNDPIRFLRVRWP